MIKYALDTREWDKTSNKWSAAMRVNAIKTARWMTRRSLAHILKVTPPKTKAQGEKAIERNLRIGFPLIDKTSAENIRSDALRAGMQAALKSRDTVAIARFAKIIYKSEAVPFSSSIYRANVSHLGKARRSGKVTADAVGWKAYLKKLKANVGVTRAGWNSAARLVGLADRDIKEFTKRHGTGYGRSNEVSRKNASYVVSTNSSIAIPIGKYALVVEAAVAVTRSSLDKLYKRVFSEMRRGKNPREVLNADIFD